MLGIDVHPDDDDVIVYTADKCNPNSKAVQIKLATGTKLKLWEMEMSVGDGKICYVDARRVACANWLNQTIVLLNEIKGRKIVLTPYA